MNDIAQPRITHEPSVTAAATVVQAGEPRSARIESLRAIAALAVVVSHAYIIGGSQFAGGFDNFLNRLIIGGGFGVDLFFVLSGYLLYWPFVRAQWLDGGQPDIRRYLVNRALRILPLYFVVLAVLMTVQHGGGSAEQWVAFASFTQNFDRDLVGTVDFPMWSLAVELQFYLVLPVIALLIDRVAGHRIGRTWMLLAGLFAVSSVVRQLLVWEQPQEGILWRFSLPSVFFFFVLGMAVALVRAQLEKRQQQLRVSSTVLVAFGVGLFFVASWEYRLEVSAGVASALLVAACVLPVRDGPFTRILEWRPLSEIGIASYSLYLWHVPILLVAGGAAVTAPEARPTPMPGGLGPVGTLLVGIPLACLVALASYRIFEAPFLRLRRRWYPPASRSTSELAAAEASLHPAAATRSP